MNIFLYLLLISKQFLITLPEPYLPDFQFLVQFNIILERVIFDNILLVILKILAFLTERFFIFIEFLHLINVFLVYFIAVK